MTLNLVRNAPNTPVTSRSVRRPRAPRHIELEGAVSQLLDRIQHANQNLGQLVDMLATDQERNHLTLEHLSILLVELLGVGETVQREGVPENDPELAAALHQYRQHLKR